MRFFNTAGPCDPRFHYMLPAAERLPEAPEIVEMGGYFVVHAPRQTGKTTTLAALARAHGRGSVRGAALQLRGRGCGRRRLRRGATGHLAERPALGRERSPARAHAASPLARER